MSAAAASPSPAVAGGEESQPLHAVLLYSAETVHQVIPEAYVLVCCGPFNDYTEGHGLLCLFKHKHTGLPYAVMYVLHNSHII